jgi:hypothetical protein
MRWSACSISFPGWRFDGNSCWRSCPACIFWPKALFAGRSAEARSLTTISSFQGS